MKYIKADALFRKVGRCVKSAADTWDKRATAISKYTALDDIESDLESALKALKELSRRRTAGTWHDLFPEGRTIYYEGDDPKGFIKEIKQKFGFDPSKSNPEWKKDYAEYESFRFFCPPEHLDAIYGSDKYPMGS